MTRAKMMIELKSLRLFLQAARTMAERDLAQARLEAAIADYNDLRD
jgi:hypothetical protein